MSDDPYGDNLVASIERKRAAKLKAKEDLERLTKEVHA